jgi:hypothetical protein
MMILPKSSGLRFSALGWCPRCEKYVVLKFDRGDLLCSHCRLVL